MEELWEFYNPQSDWLEAMRPGRAGTELMDQKAGFTEESFFAAPPAN